MHQSNPVSERKEVKSGAATSSYPVTSGERFTVAQKLLALRQSVLADSLISEELAYYVPPNGQLFLGSEESDPLQPWMEENLKAGQARVILLKGPGGAGKSTFSRHLLRALWQNSAWQSWQPGQTPPGVLAPLFIPLGSNAVDPQHLLAYLSHLPEPLVSFNDEEMNILKADYNLLLIADGYDEISEKLRCNLYDANLLDRYEGRIKLLISSRIIMEGRERLENNQFVPHRLGSVAFEWRYYKERFIAPFNAEQIESYLRVYLQKNKHRTDIALWPTVARYQQQFATMPKFRDLISTPFLLWITAEVLPTIVKEAEETIPEVKGSAGAFTEHKQEVKGIESKSTHLQQQRHLLTQAKLYRYFMMQWFSRQTQKAINARDILEEPEAILGEADVEAIVCNSGAMGDQLAGVLLQRAYLRFCQMFATHLQAEARVSIPNPVGGEEKSTPTWIKALFSSQDPDWVRIRKGCPIRLNGKEYGFIHASLIDYFVTTVVAEQATAPQQMTEMKTQPMPTPIPPTTVVATQDAPAPLENIPGKEILKRLFPRSTLLLSADDLKENNKHSRSLRAYFNSLIESSKTDASFAIGAANAITILNAAGENFSNRDFSNIRIPGADLSGALLDHTNFKGANLSQVSLQGVWAYAAQFQNVQATGLRFGQEPYFEIGQEVTCCSFSPNGKEMAIAVNDGVMIWDVATRHIVRYFGGEAYGLSSVKTIAYSPQGDRIAIGGFDDFERKENSNIGNIPSSIRIWEVATGEELQRLSGHRGIITAIAWNSVGTIIITGAYDHTARLWDPTTGKERGQFEHPDDVLSVAWNGVEDFIATSSQSGEKAPTEERGGYMRVGSSEGIVRIWKLNHEEETITRLFNLGHEDVVRAMAWDPQGVRLACGSQDGVISIWNGTKGEGLRSFRGHVGGVEAILWDGQGERLISAGDDHLIRIWDSSTGKELRQFTGHTRSVNAITWQNSRALLASSSTDNTVRVWDTNVEPELHPLTGHRDEVRAIAWNKQGDILASFGGDNIVHLRDYDTGEGFNRLRHEQTICSIVWDPKGTQIACGGNNGAIYVWNIADGRQLFQLTGGHESEIHSMAWNSRGDLLASTSYEGVWIWDITKKRVLRQFTSCLDQFLGGDDDSSGSLRSGDFEIKTVFPRHLRLSMARRVKSITWYPGTDQVVFSTYDRKLRVWDVMTGQEVSQFKGSVAEDPMLRLDPQGKTLAATTNQGVVFWDKQNNQNAFKNQQFISALDWDGVGKHLAVGENDTIKVFDINTKKCLHTWKLPSRIQSLAWIDNQQTSLLAVAFGKDIACYQFTNNLPHLIWMTVSGATLYLEQSNMTGVRGLSLTNTQLLRQHAVKGLPREDIAMSAAEIRYFTGEEHSADQDYLLGICCAEGRGELIQTGRAKLYFQKAAQMDHPRAQYYLGLLDDSEENLLQAVQLIKTQAESVPDAWLAYTLADIYQTGKGVIVDNDQADFWYSLAVPLLLTAAKDGIAHAQFCLGQCYEQGLGVRADKQAAMNWYQLAAKQGYALAQTYLAKCYKDGFIVDFNLISAIEWYDKAKIQGSLEASKQWKEFFKTKFSRQWAHQTFSTDAVANKLHYEAIHDDETFNTALTLNFIESETLGVESKVDFNVADNEGDTPLHWVAAAGPKKHILPLLEQKADLNRANLEGQTPIHKAALQGQQDIITLLLEKKANPNLETRDGLTPLDLAIKLNHSKTIRIFREQQAEGRLSSLRLGYPVSAAMSALNAAEKSFYLGESNEINLDYLLGISYRRGYGVKINLAKAQHHFKKAADSKHARSQYYLGVLSSDNKKAQPLFAQSFEDIKKSAESKRDVWAVYTLACMYACGDGIPRNSFQAQNWFSMAIPLLYQAVQQGIVIAQLLLGNCYEQGNGVQKDMDVAIKWYRLAAMQGLSVAQESLAKSCHSSKETLYWYCKSAAQGSLDAHKVLQERTKARNNYIEVKNSDNLESYFLHTPYPLEILCMSEKEKNYFIGRKKHISDSDYLLGVGYRYGYGVGISLPQAIQFFRKAATQGHVRAKFYLAFMRHNKEDVTGDEKTTNQYLEQVFPEIKKQAESKSDAWSAYTLAGMYQKGLGVAADLLAANAWYKVAVPLLQQESNNGVSAAWALLGLCFERARGVDKDEKAAIRWYRMAADEGRASAQARLGLCYENGNGVGRDSDKASEWYRQAGMRGLLSIRSQYEKLIKEQLQNLEQSAIACFQAGALDEAIEIYEAALDISTATSLQHPILCSLAEAYQQRYNQQHEEADLELSKLNLGKAFKISQASIVNNSATVPSLEIETKVVKQIASPLSSPGSASLFLESATSQSDVSLKAVRDLLDQVYPAKEIVYEDMRNMYLEQLAEFQQRQNNLTAGDKEMLRQLYLALQEQGSHAVDKATPSLF